MAFRLYLVPVIGVGTKQDPRRPKYFAETLARWAGMDYGQEPSMIVGSNLSEGDDALIAGHPDVSAFPFDLSQPLTDGQVTAVKNKLEAANLPAGWVSTDLTWTEVVRTVLGIFSYVQRYMAMYAKAQGSLPPSIYGSGVTLDTAFGTLPVAVRTAMLDAADSFNIPTTGLTAATPLRAILKAMANYFQDQPFVFNGVVI